MQGTVHEDDHADEHEGATEELAVDHRAFTGSTGSWLTTPWPVLVAIRAMARPKTTAPAASPNMTPARKIRRATAKRTPASTRPATAASTTMPITTPATALDMRDN